jgi:hypothetical protein
LNDHHTTLHLITQTRGIDLISCTKDHRGEEEDEINEEDRRNEETTNQLTEQKIPNL